ncbi:MAG: tetratricopeptide repeat protein [Planctomycetota bacterium]
MSRRTEKFTRGGEAEPQVARPRVLNTTALPACGESGRERCGTGILPVEAKAGSLCHNFCHGLLRAGSIALLTLVVYVPAMRAGFTWNDDTFLYDNPLIRADDGLYRFWFTTQAPDYFPLVSTTLWLEWRLWGTDVRGYHVVNVLLHALSSVLLWRLLRRLAVPGAWLAALVFAVHPVNVESVAWITERKNTLPMVFYLLTVLLYLWFEREPRRRWYGLALFAFLLALLSKTSVVMLPFLLLGCAWWQRRRIAHLDLLRSVPFFVLALIFGLLTVWFQYIQAIGEDVVRTDSFGSRLAVAGWAVWFYLYKALLPFGLCFIYPRWQVNTTSFVPYLPSAALTAVLAVLFAYRRTWGRPLLAGLGYFVLTLFPVLGFLNIYFMRYSLVADHWQYTSIVGIITLVVGVGAHVVRARGQAVRTAVALGAALVVGSFSVLTWQRANLYRDEEALYLDTLAKNPSAWLAHNNLGQVYQQRGRHADAIKHLNQALELYPGYALAHFNMGTVLADLGNLDEAIRHYEESLKLNPRAPDVHSNLGGMLVRQGRLEEARAHFATAVGLAPRWFDARYNLGQTLVLLGHADEAIVQLEEALRINPDSAPARYHLGNILANQGRPDLAVAHFAETVRLAPDWAEAHNNLGRALAALGKLEEAVDHYAEAVRLAPGFALAYRNLGAALADGGRLDEAVQAYTQALSIEPQNADVHCRLGDLLARQGRADLAAQEYRRALEVEPDHPQARQGLEAVSGPPGR